MITQFGYVVIWSAVWPLAPVFALINNWFELRADALKICKHVRRPVGDRVESIGAWLHTLSIISWIGAVTNATLIYLFRPSTTLQDQSPNPEIPITGSIHLYEMTRAYSLSPTLQTVLPTLIPLVAVALTASHGFIIIRYVVEAVAERLLWRGSREEMQIQNMRAQTNKVVTEGLAQLDKRTYGAGGPPGNFWNGGEEGAREIGRIAKNE